ncbi:hypothetical protein [uncultured Roseibium sp.]|uniref:hypothetical protein n=1 Tax=uncultured Roseibium sp. TaxID=1936171 RepID=UPI00260304D8|nr:hypothetical protein [uncultured Roseibium sp.]
MSNDETSKVGRSLPDRFMIGGVGLLALLSASCCVLPIGLSILGVSSAWIILLSPFIAYRLELLTIAGLLLTWSWFRIWKKRKCTLEKRSPLLILILTTCAFGLALSSPVWEAEAARAMWDLWRGTR